ncbi:patatin-like phospholipase family protein [Cohnella cellulosilytica]|uniref:Patatin-like phospholipase family protein n=1 Tax=Cohnella cellulosilytica TaxID=986710 RepID=A0ABW2FEE3_9BACL
MLEKLRQYPIVDQLEAADKEALFPYLSESEYADSSVILRNGQKSDRFHIVLSGVVVVYIEDEVPVTLAELTRGQFFGEMSCLTGEAVSASIMARGPVVTLSMPRDGMLTLMDRSSAFRRQVMENMIARIRSSNHRVVEEHARSYVVLREMERQRQIGYGPLIGSSPFMRELRQELERLAVQEFPVCIVGENGVGKLHIAYRLHDGSPRRDYPLLTVDGDGFNWEEWERKVRAARGGSIVLKHADALPGDVLQRVVRTSGECRVVMTALKPPQAEVRQIHSLPLRERTEDIPELVYEFLSKAGASHPRDAITESAMRMLLLFPFLKGNVGELKKLVEEAYLLSRGNVIRNTHLRFSGPRKPGTRPTIGLALGSGSVRGAAHVGVLKALEQEQIPVDLIAGSSVGAFIGALYAGGQPISAFERVLPTVRWRQLVQFMLNPKAFVSNHRMIRFIEKYIGPVDFEELRIPFAAVAANALTGESHILNTGRVSHAICASTAIPGIIKPVSLDNRLLIDGGVVHAVPVALAKSMGADLVIAVDVSLGSSTKKAPKHFIGSILNTIEIMSEKIRQDELQLADVVLHPDFGINPLSFKASPSLIQMGEKAAREAMASILKKIGPLNSADPSYVRMEGSL